MTGKNRAISQNPSLNNDDLDGEFACDDMLQFFPDFNGTQDSAAIKKEGNVRDDPFYKEDELSSDSSSYDGKPQKKVHIPDDAPWKNKEYYRLPPNVRNAIDIAEMKKKHSSFFYKLETLNDKIFVFRELYYSKMP